MGSQGIPVHGKWSDHETRSVSDFLVCGCGQVEVDAKLLYPPGIADKCVAPREHDLCLSRDGADKRKLAAFCRVTADALPFSTRYYVSLLIQLSMAASQIASRYEDRSCSRRSPVNPGRRVKQMRAP
jgi:hypothetical protein